ncbi:acyltransferase [Desertihabitans aurantiacus]|uniref:acyltransferase n=1 Tax=Desertihabitans aurantiacus TaxID=2282477 RepID=UPI0013009889|nr:acyltransferase [Desertihabitans aurantiacus]
MATARTPGNPGSGGSPSGAATTRARLQQIDFMRVVVFTFVVSAHVVTVTLDMTDLWVSGWGMLMHFTRYAFVFISAFVLFHSYRDRPLRATTFWRKRFGTVVLPYLVWTLLYGVVRMVDEGVPGLTDWLVDYARRVATGSEWYHLYFLLISIQLYLFFPLVRWVVDRFAGRHGLLLALAAVVQLGAMALVSLAPAPPGPASVLWTHPDVAFGLYTLFVVGGGVCALHVEQLNRWIGEHRVLLVALGAGGLAVTLGIYLVRATGGSAELASLPGHPGLVPWAVAATMVVYALGTAWVNRGVENRLSQRVVAAGAHRAFGVFAVHPLVLWMLNWLVVPTLTTWVPQTLPRTLLVFVLTQLGALLLVELLLRTPFSKVLVARPRARRPDVATG